MLIIVIVGVHRQGSIALNFKGFDARREEYLIFDSGVFIVPFLIPVTLRGDVGINRRLY